MTTEQLLYDYETIIGEAVTSAFQAGGFQASMYTGQTGQEFQKVRPRCEIQFKSQGVDSPPVLMPDGTFRQMSFSGELMVAAITDSNADGKNTHGEYRAKVRSFCYSLRPLVNETFLTQHKIQWLTEHGTTQGFAPERGEETSVLSFHVKFSLQATAFSFTGTT